MEHLKNVRVWLRGLVAAVIGGVANSITTVIVAPETFNLQEGLPKLGQFAAVSAILSGALYLKQSPIPAVSEGSKDGSSDEVGN